MKRRWIIYAIIGVVFGIFDFFYQEFIVGLISSQQLDPVRDLIAWAILVVGIWLVPVIPVILHEVKVTRSARSGAMANVFILCISVIVYYLTNGAQLAFIGVPARMEMHISNRGEPWFWQNWQSLFVQDLIGGSIEWLIVAVVGGTIIGFLVGLLSLRLQRRRVVSALRVPGG